MNSTKTLHSFTFLPNVNNPYGGGHDHIVHATGCKDTQCLQAEQFGDGIIIEAVDLVTAEQQFRADWYADFDADTQWLFSSDVKPCAQKLGLS